MGWLSWLNPIGEWFQLIFSKIGVLYVPGSTYFIILFNVIIAILMSLLTRALINVDKISRHQKEIKIHNQNKKKAMEVADKKLWQKVQRREEYIKKIQSEMMIQQMKPMLVYFIPITMIFFLMRTAFLNIPVAWMPFRFPEIWIIISNLKYYEGLTYMGFTGWYFLTSIGLGNYVRRFMGASPSATRMTPQL
ncbi:MAG: EMC3/TMCO1 family protein [Candidatus Heimdallarchaeota archaeon]